MANDKIIIMPHEGFQRQFVRSNVDICFGGSSMGCGKTYGAVLATVEPSLDSRWRGLFLRNNLDDTKSAGGFLDTFKDVYGDTIQIRTSDMPRIIFPSGAYCDITHVADQSRETLLRRFKGRQYDFIYFDEGTGYSWTTFTTILSRNRGQSAFNGKCLLTTNPEKEHWIREFIDWYVDADGYINEERNGIVRYFYMMGRTHKDVVWGDSKEEVYNKCRATIDDSLDKIYGFRKGREKWPSMIKSFTFYLGRMSENKEMTETNDTYPGSVAMMGGAEAEKNLNGNWNASSKDENDGMITFDEANSVFGNDPMINGDRWITADLADFGTNNFVQLAWDGLHVIDIDIAPFTRPMENAERMKMFASKHDIGYSHIIFDGIRGRYINDYIPEAVPYESNRAPYGVNALQYFRLKDCCYAKLIWLVKNEGISFSENVARRAYVNVAAKTKSQSTVQEEFIQEMRVLRFVDANSGKKRLPTKKEMNRLLGEGRSMDLADPCSMRMLPLLDIADGYELESSRTQFGGGGGGNSDIRNTINIYDDTVWA